MFIRPMAKTKRSGGEMNLVEKEAEAGRQQGHGSDEQGGDAAGKADFARRGDEQHGNHQANEQGACRAAGDCPVGGEDSPIEQPKLDQRPAAFDIVIVCPLGIKRTGPVDRPGEATGEDIENSADSGQQEDGCNRELDLAGDGRDVGRWIHSEDIGADHGRTMKLHG